MRVPRAPARNLKCWKIIWRRCLYQEREARRGASESTSTVVHLGGDVGNSTVPRMVGDAEGPPGVAVVNDDH